MSTYFTIDETAERLKINKQTVVRIIKRKELSATKIGRFWRISEDHLDEYLDNRTVKAKKTKYMS